MWIRKITLAASIVLLSACWTVDPLTDSDVVGTWIGSYRPNEETRLLVYPEHEFKEINPAGKVVASGHWRVVHSPQGHRDFLNLSYEKGVRVIKPGDISHQIESELGSHRFVTNPDDDLWFTRVSSVVSSR